MLLLLHEHLTFLPFRAKELHRLAELVRTRQDLLHFSMGVLYLFFFSFVSVWFAVLTSGLYAATQLDA